MDSCLVVVRQRLGEHEEEMSDKMLKILNDITVNSFCPAKEVDKDGSKTSDEVETTRLTLFMERMNIPEL